MAYINGNKVFTVNNTVYMGENLNVISSPQGVDTSTNILAKTSNQGVWVGSDTGGWYYWNGSGYSYGGSYLPIIDGSYTDFISKSSGILVNESLDYSTQYLSYNKYNINISSGNTLVFNFDRIVKIESITFKYDDNTTGTYYVYNKYKGEFTLPKNVIGIGYYKLANRDGEFSMLMRVKNDLNIYDKLDEYTINNCNSFYTINWTPTSVLSNYNLIPLYVKSGTSLMITRSKTNYYINLLVTYSDNTTAILTNFLTNVKTKTITLTKDVKAFGLYVGANEGDGEIELSFNINNTFNLQKQINELPHLITPITNYGALGDSITAQYLTNETQYIDLIKNALSCNVINYGIAGNRIAKRDGDTSEAMCVRYTDMSNDLDVITIFGGTNDYNAQIPLGTDDSTDIYTFKGALNVLCVGLLNKYTNCQKIGFITPLQRNDDTNLIDYVNAIKTICAKYSIPVLDLYNNGGITCKINSTANGYLQDGLHPTAKGQRVIANKILSFILSL